MTRITISDLSQTTEVSNLSNTELEATKGGFFFFGGFRGYGYGYGYGGYGYGGYGYGGYGYGGFRRF